MEPKQFISTSHNDAGTVAFLNRLFRDAANNGASDLHLEDYESGCRVRWRIDGNMVEKPPIARELALNIDNKIRMKARLPISERKVPLDGRFFLEIDERSVDVRVNLLPIRHGQSMVFRLLDQSTACRRLREIPMPEGIRATLHSVLEGPEGLLLVVGPTGSGKTSTLYACLSELNNAQRKIVTIEDPVEYRLDYACQVNVDAGLTFGSALRATLRQDPDVVLVGEIRDSETAKTAIQAALTGHLVLSSLHANDTVTALSRLVDLGVDPYSLGMALRGAIAQRLCAKLCPLCRTPDAAQLAEDDVKWLNRLGYLGQQVFYRSVGCDSCGQTGQYGRTPIMEMVVADAALRRAIHLGDRKSLLAAAGRQAQYQNLALSAVRAGTAGLISFAGARAFASVAV